ncbi:hypothetical protein [Rhizobium gallicum]|uniref:hypothetical protein n=1 Tax=Rhizobium gallicum TaxID=56730 RepID=UPI001EF77DE9|nr:hypothetical protein [Rhizobium gallicum]ULJ73550.1 hypothetical protein L2W42_08225 [Rhizobium gallicum]
MAEIRLVAYRGPNFEFQQSWENITQVLARVQLLGDFHKVIVLKADRKPIVGRKPHAAALSFRCIRSAISGS